MKTKDPQLAREKKKAAQRRRRKALGFVFSLLAIIGVAAIVTVCVNVIHARFFDDSKDKEAYARLIAPLVAMDPDSFPTLADANKDVLLESAVWAALSYEDNTKYSRNDKDEIILPTVDVERYYSQMYGPDAKIEHHTFTDVDIEFTYDSAQSAYIIPITGLSGAYTPVVESITKSGSTKVLVVSYMEGSSDASDVVLNPNTQIVAKQKQFVLAKGSKGYYIVSVLDYDAAAEQKTA